MKSTAKILIAAIAAAVSVGVVADGAHMEKCYGVSRAEKNDCGTDVHACAGLAKEDCQWDEWILLPKGLCAKLVDGSLTPVKKKSNRKK